MATATTELLERVSAADCLDEYCGSMPPHARVRRRAQEIQDALGYRGLNRQLVEAGELTSGQLDLLAMLKELGLCIFDPTSVNKFKTAKAYEALAAEKAEYQPKIREAQSGLFWTMFNAAAITGLLGKISGSISVILLVALLGLIMINAGWMDLKRVRRTTFRAEWESHPLSELTIDVPGQALNLMMDLKRHFPRLEFRVETLAADPLLYVNNGSDASLCIFQWDEEGFNPATL